MGNKSSKSNGVSGETRATAKRTSFKDSLRSLTSRRPKQSEEIPEDQGPKIILEVPVENYTFPFENIVFEGGGYKCLAYCGAIRCLEEVGIWRCVRRLAGSSTGAAVAALMSVGYNSYQLERYLNREDLADKFTDRSCGCCSLARNITTKYGAHPADKFYRWFSQRIKDATGNVDITFMQVYEKFGRELCIPVTNVSLMVILYCHPKTTPDMPIRLAIRMSVSFPGLVQPVKYSSNDFNEYFTDGGILCNYPINCFDGWWLSLKPGDSFLENMSPLSEISKHTDPDIRFGAPNERTLGFMAYGDHEEDPLQHRLETRANYKDLVEAPDSQLAKSRKELRDAQKYAADKHTDLSLALRNFLKALKDHGMDETKSLTKNDLQNILSKRTELTDIDLRILFGKSFDSDSIFNEMGVDKNDMLEVSEMIRHVDKRGLRYLAHYMNYRRRDITNAGLYSLVLHECLLSRRHGVKKQDMERTVGINTRHISASDYRLETADKKFLVEQGKKATKDFLEYHVTQRLNSDGDSGKDYEQDDLGQFMDDDLSEIINTRDYMEDMDNII